jgi:hypothetical protein
MKLLQLTIEHLSDVLDGTYSFDDGNDISERGLGAASSGADRRTRSSTRAG